MSEEALMMVDCLKQAQLRFGLKQIQTLVICHFNLRAFLKTKLCAYSNRETKRIDIESDEDSFPFIESYKDSLALYHSFCP